MTSVTKRKISVNGLYDKIVGFFQIFVISLHSSASFTVLMINIVLIEVVLSLTILCM